MLTEIATAPLLYLAFPVLGALAGFIALSLGWFLAYSLDRHSVLTSRAGSIATRIAHLVATELSAQELLSRIDPETVAARLDGPLRKLVDETTVELMQRHKPDLWELLPLRFKRVVIERARDRAPELASAVLAALEADAGDVLELEPLILRVLSEDPVLLARIGRELSTPIRNATTRRGTLFSFLIGVLEIPLVAGTHSAPAAALAPLVLVPAARWLAGLRLSADLEHNRARIAAALGERIADPVLGFGNIITELVSGPRSERVRQLVRREVTSAIDAQTSVAKPLVSAALGANKFQHIKRGAAERALSGAPTLTRLVDEYAEESMQVRAALAFRLRRTPVDRLEPPFRAVLAAARARCYLIAVLIGLVLGGAQFAITAGMPGVS
ncbi:hypothetical protein [Sciscionella marina]|uniref:hypothetical protein n=1 Tax=Sciscionella marina TaxID=508770 RepID=UPI000375C34D|nr:hypothetical protein [Sciscionella marina]